MGLCGGGLRWWAGFVVVVVVVIWVVATMKKETKGCDEELEVVVWCGGGLKAMMGVDHF